MIKIFLFFFAWRKRKKNHAKKPTFASFFATLGAEKNSFAKFCEKAKPCSVAKGVFAK